MDSTTSGVVSAGPAVLTAISMILNMVRQAAFSIVSALRIALVLGIAIANPIDMFRAASNWSTRVSVEFDTIASRVDDALSKAGEGWTAADFDALEAKIKDAIKELKTAQSGAGLVAAGLTAVATAYMLFWAFAATVAFVLMVLVVKVNIARATVVAAAPTQAAAEAAANGLASALDAFVAKLAAVNTAAGTLFGGVVLAGLGGPVFSPAPEATRRLEQLRIEWAPPNQWISPVKQDPEPYGS
jgi:hypothetical protein